MHVGGLVTLFIGLIISVGSFFGLFGTGRFVIIFHGLLSFRGLTMYQGKNKMKS